MTKTMCLLVTSGDGPIECRHAVLQVCRLMREEAQNAALCVDELTGKSKHAPRSAVMQFHGRGAEDFCQRWVGTIQWICKSPFRKGHKRQNWFIGVSPISAGGTRLNTDLKQIRFDTFRAGGPGGQHQNTTDSAVRATCIETGLSVVAREGRSQHRNKALAIERLQSLSEAIARADQARQSASQHALHHRLERGNPVRVFKGANFREVV